MGGRNRYAEVTKPGNVSKESDHNSRDISFTSVIAVNLTRGPVNYYKGNFFSSYSVFIAPVHHMK